MADRHAAWRRTTLNLLPAENVTSQGALALLSSEIATRLSEGLPGDKEFPPPRHNVEIDEIEGVIVGYLARFFGARFVEWRAASNTLANAMVLEALTRPGDRLLVQAYEGGANMSYHPGAVPELLRLEVESLPWAEDYGIDLEGARAAARRVRPRVIVVGGGYALFPLPVAQLRSIADEVGAALMYDAAHVGLHVAFSGFPNPLAEGAGAMTLGTHKVMGGPIGGVVLTDDPALASRIIDRGHPLFHQTRDQNKYAAAAYALAELAEHGPGYAAAIVANAKALARALEDAGLRCLGRSRGYTDTHQVVVDLERRDSLQVETRCQEADILLHRGRLPGEGNDSPHSALRLTVQELTRQGMGPVEMTEVATLIARAAGGEPADRVRGAVHALTARFPTIRYSFDDGA